MIKIPTDPNYDAEAALLARVLAPKLSEVKGVLERVPHLSKQLNQFSFPAVAKLLGGLLTRVENHTATARIEALIHGATLACRGKQRPAEKQLRKWLNDLVYKDPITELEGPTEDVFLSNIVTDFGNIRLFNGRWKNNGDYVQVCILALRQIADRPWAMEAHRQVMALLKLSEAIAEKANVARNVRTESLPRESIETGTSAVSKSTDHVTFSNEEIVALGIDRDDLDLFVFQNKSSDSLSSQFLGNTELERRPLVRYEGRLIVALPTSIGAASRRFVLEKAARQGDLTVLQSTYHHLQFGEVFLLGRAAWEIEFIEALEHKPDDNLREFIGRFDDGGYVHLIFVPDAFEGVIQAGLASIHRLEGIIKDRIDDRSGRIAAKPDYRRGLTVLVHGGIGRDYAPLLGDVPCGWHQLSLSAPDFMLLGNESEFTAMRAWKLLQQVDDLKGKGVVFQNLSGFLNLVAFAYYVGFELVPSNMSLGPIYLHSDFLLLLRHRVRVALDRHAVTGPDGKSWVSVQRETCEFLDQPQGRPVFHCAEQMVHHELLACVETAKGIWWVQCRELPQAGWSRSIAFNILDMVLGWLSRLAPMLETQLSIPNGILVMYRFRFSDIETFRQKDSRVAETSAAPRLAFEDGQVVIECTSRFLQSFIGLTNLGDRHMVAALVQGAYGVTGRVLPSEIDLVEWVQTVVSSDDARYFQIAPSQAPQDIVYDLAALPSPRLVMPEDQGWSSIDLARRAGFEPEPGPIPAGRVGEILGNAVQQAWLRVRSRLLRLSRESVIERSLLNFVAVMKEHRDWHRSAAAQLALHDKSEVLRVANQRAVRRDTAGLACRAIAEMALCTSPYGSGSDCTDVDLDFLIAEVATLLQCAFQSDAWRYGLAAREPTMNPNGSFWFDRSTFEATGPFLLEHGRRRFLESAADQGIESGRNNDKEIPNEEFEAAFIAEFGLSTDQYAMFVFGVALEASKRGSAKLRLLKSEVLRRLRDAGAVNPDRVFDTLVLKPRARWDERSPENARKRDWYPWRFSRRLSILRRPLLQFSAGADDPVILVMPSVVAGTLDFLQEAPFGRLPEELFDSPEMKSCIGRAADRNGHDFNRRVAERLDELEWNTMQEVSLTRLGGKEDLGDVDVLAWRPDSGLVHVVECKSLRMDRTCGEIGERLADYADGSVYGKRTPLQKHLDRVSYLNANHDQLSKLTAIPVERLQLRSALVTEKLVPMQFAGKAREALDLVTDFEFLEEALRGM